MARELPRTLRSLAPTYQRGIAADDYEVIVVDNGSPEPLDPAIVDGFGGRIRTARVDPAPHYPAPAANLGLSLAEGELVGLLVDGARMASPGLLAHARVGSRLAPRPVVATLGWHLGPARHSEAETTGWDREAEDRLLAGLGWEEDGYCLFGASTLAASSARGPFAPMGESNALFMPRDLWAEVGGLDPAFDLLGGGLSNHDLYRRACEHPGVRLVVLLGEGTFHQTHGGAATSGRIGWDEMHAQYVALRGRPYRPPEAERIYVGRVHPAVVERVGVGQKVTGR